jgi:cysteine synthase
MAQIADKSILQTIGNTPLVKLAKIVPENCADIFVKLEYFNPTGSYKDRMAPAIIEEAENGRARAAVAKRRRLLDPAIYK